MGNSFENNRELYGESQNRMMGRRMSIMSSGLLCSLSFSSHMQKVVEIVACYH